MGGSVSVVSFWVGGEPAPQGSKRHVGGGRLIESSKKLPAWREAVRSAAAEHAPKEPFDQPVILWADFYLPKPKKPRFWSPAVTPDLDKLLRALNDGLEAGGVVRNDSRVVEVSASKNYVSKLHPDAGVRVTVIPVREVDCG